MIWSIHDQIVAVSKLTDDIESNGINFENESEFLK